MNEHRGQRIVSATRREFLAASVATVGTVTLAVAALTPSTAMGDRLTVDEAAAGATPEFEPAAIPEWVRGVTRMSFLGPDQVADAARIGVQVVHGNAVWPYYPLRRDGGKLKDAEHALLKRFVDETHRHGMKLSLGLPPFPSVEAMKAHPEWRIAADATDAHLKIEPVEDNLGTRLGCNLGPWGDYLIELCGELMEDYGFEGYSFDGNYHPPICYCPACRKAYRDERHEERSRDLPAAIDLDNIAYREYLVWRGEKLEDHYRRLQKRLKGIRPDAAVMTWSTNAGRYGHFLTSPRVMSTRMNLLIDLPMQEWWLDETNLGSSVAPAFGAEYLAAVTGYRKCGCEPYLMSRGNPYSPDSFPAHERMVRSMTVLAHGSTTAHSLGWTGGADGAAPVFAETKRREPWIVGGTPLAWAAILVSEQTRQFYAYRDIAERFLPHVFGAYRMVMEEHLPAMLINDWDVTSESLRRFRVVVLPNAAALSDAQVAALREYVRGGGSLVATTETSLCDELGRPRRDFALADLFGVSYRGRPQTAEDAAAKTQIDPNFAIALDENYWRQRVGSGTLAWSQHALVDDAALRALVPNGTARFKGPQVLVSPPADATEVAVRLIPDGPTGTPQPGVNLPGVVVRQFGEGRVAYFAAGVDAALFSYAYPYQRMLLARAVEWAAGGGPPVRVAAPKCVQTTFYERTTLEGKRQLVIHLLNNVNTTADHGFPGTDVPLREESVPIHDMQVTVRGLPFSRWSVEPGNVSPRVETNGNTATIHLPPLEVHAILVGDV
ncbi:MAG: alpha-amylase family protein [Pirellulales bacterium]